MVKRSAFHLLFLISSPKLGLQAEEICRREQIPEQLYAFAKGTASGELQDLLGLGEIEKSVLIAPLSGKKAADMIERFREELYLGTPGSGVAFTVPINGASTGLIRLLEQSETEEETNEREKDMSHDYSMVLALVNQGYSEEVMAAARSAGAGGGTVFHSRRVAGDDALHFWGIQIQEEREIVLILVKQEKKKAIMSAISEKCGVRSDAHGMILSLPVDEVAGLKKEI